MSTSKEDLIPLAEKVRDALKELGDSPEDVFHSLKKKGIHKAGTGATNCPIAQFTKGMIPDDVTTFAWTGGVELRSTSNDFIIVKLPVAVFHFILRYDTGHYQELRVESPGFPM